MTVFFLPAHIQGLIFDVDSTLYTCPAFAEAQIQGQIARLAERRGQSLAAMKGDLEAYRADWSKANDGKKLSLGNAFVHFGISIAESVRWREELIDPKPYLKRDLELIEALENLSSRFGLGIATNNPALVALRILSALGVESYFKTIIALDTCGVSKPHKAPFLKAATDLGAKPGTCVAIGDRYDIDIALPLELGMGGVLVDGVTDVYELPALLKAGVIS